MPSVVGKNVLCGYGRSAQTAHRTERILVVLLLFLLCSLCCISLQCILFRCQIGILVLEKITKIAFTPTDLYILASQGGVTWHE